MPLIRFFVKIKVGRDKKKYNVTFLNDILPGLVMDF